MKLNLFSMKELGFVFGHIGGKPVAPWLWGITEDEVASSGKLVIDDTLLSDSRS